MNVSVAGSGTYRRDNSCLNFARSTKNSGNNETAVNGDRLNNVRTDIHDTSPSIRVPSRSTQSGSLMASMP